MQYYFCVQQGLEYWERLVLVQAEWQLVCVSLLEASPPRHRLSLTCRKPRGFSAICDIWGSNYRRVFFPSVSQRKDGSGIPTQGSFGSPVETGWGMVPLKRVHSVRGGKKSTKKAAEYP